MKAPVIIKSGVEMDKKVATLNTVRVDPNSYSTYYIDVTSGEKWVEEHPEGELHAGGPPQLRLIGKFPWED